MGLSPSLYSLIYFLFPVTNPNVLKKLDELVTKKKVNISEVDNKYIAILIL